MGFVVGTRQSHANSRETPWEYHSKLTQIPSNQSNWDPAVISIEVRLEFIDFGHCPTTGEARLVLKDNRRVRSSPGGSGQAKFSRKQAPLAPKTSNEYWKIVAAYNYMTLYKSLQCLENSGIF